MCGLSVEESLFYEEDDQGSLILRRLVTNEVIATKLDLCLFPISLPKSTSQKQNRLLVDLRKIQVITCMFFICMISPKIVISCIDMTWADF